MSGLPAGVPLARCRHCGRPVGRDAVGFWWAADDLPVTGTPFCAHEPEEVAP